MSAPGTLKPFASIEGYLAGEECSDIRHEAWLAEIHDDQRQPCPRLMGEALSDSAAHIDHCEKLLVYQIMPSLKAYPVGEQGIRQVELYHHCNNRQAEYIEQGDTPLPRLDTVLAIEGGQGDAQ